MTSKVMDIFPPTLASVSTIVSMATTVVLGLENQMSRIQDGESIRMRRFKKQQTVLTMVNMLTVFIHDT